MIKLHLKFAQTYMSKQSAFHTIRLNIVVNETLIFAS